MEHQIATYKQKHVILEEKAKQYDRLMNENWQLEKERLGFVELQENSNEEKV